MSTVVTPVEDPGPMPSLTLVDIGALRQGLEEAIALTLRGQATGVVILAPRDRGCKAWHAGPGAATAAGRCRLTLLSKSPLDDEPPALDVA